MQVKVENIRPEPCFNFAADEQLLTTELRYNSYSCGITEFGMDYKIRNIFLNVGSVHDYTRKNRRIFY